MNLHTFRDVVNSKKAALAHDLDEGEEDAEVGRLRGPVDGEEDDGAEKVWGEYTVDRFYALI
jgi:hypothetical protein